VQRVGAVAGLIVALAAASVSAQPATGARSSGWRATVSAALAFGHAEGKAAALARVAIPTAPATRYATEAALEQLDRAATEAREAYAAVVRYGSAYWTVAAEARIGDMFACQAARSVAVLRARRSPPVPPAIAEMLDAAAQPFRNQAIVHWDLASAGAERSGIAPHWFLLVSRPGC
jgi:hypothetical protein